MSSWSEMKIRSPLVSDSAFAKLPLKPSVRAFLWTFTANVAPAAKRSTISERPVGRTVVADDKLVGRPRLPSEAVSCSR